MKKVGGGGGGFPKKKRKGMYGETSKTGDKKTLGTSVGNGGENSDQAHKRQVTKGREVDKTMKTYGKGRWGDGGKKSRKDRSEGVETKESHVQEEMRLEKKKWCKVIGKKSNQLRTSMTKTRRGKSLPQVDWGGMLQNGKNRPFEKKLISGGFRKAWKKNISRIQQSTQGHR